MDPIAHDQMGRTCIVHRGLRPCVERAAGAVTLVATRVGADSGEFALVGEPGLADENLLKQFVRLGDLFAGARNIDP